MLWVFSTCLLKESGVETTDIFQEGGNLTWDWQRYLLNVRRAPNFQPSAQPQNSCWMHSVCVRVRKLMSVCCGCGTLKITQQGNLTQCPPFDLLWGCTCFSVSQLAFVQPVSHAAISLRSALNYSGFFQVLSASVYHIGKAVIPPGAVRTGLACPHHCKSVCDSVVQHLRLWSWSWRLSLDEKCLSAEVLLQGYMCKQSVPPIKITPPWEAAPGGALCTSLCRQRCELTEEAARIWFLHGKPPWLFSTGQ